MIFNNLRAGTIPAPTNGAWCKSLVLMNIFLLTINIDFKCTIFRKDRQILKFIFAMDVFLLCYRFN
jgi:hypothetical protein